MKHFALACLVAVLGCKKANDAGGAGAAGSSSAGSAITTGSAAGSATASAAGSASASAAGSAAPAAELDDKLTMPKLPKRDKDEQARIDGGVDALRTALTQANAAKDSAELCKAFPPLLTAMSKLQMISAPKGVDQQMFSSQRDALLQLFDGADAWCDKPANIGLDTLQHLMSDIRSQFVAFVSRGAQ
ncbi:MAG: hypothetical protein JWO36_7395 [Myxococcales bacterium]|nr:hypothetical protein [Myxococcales bacterium]